MATALVGWWSQYLSANVTCFLALLAVMAITVWYRYGYRPYQYFKNLGVPGPKPLPFIGNLHQARSELFDFKELCNKYGDVCGFYIGNTPVLVVGNPEMVKEITIKQSANFLDRSACSGLFCSYKNGVKYVSIFVQRGEEWKKSRQLISPAFSAHKLKMLEPRVQESVKVLAKRIAKTKGETVDIVRWYRELTSEVILNTVLGHQVKVQQGEGTKLFNHLESVLHILTRARGHLPFFIQIGAAMSWMADYVLVPLLKNRFTAVGRGSLAVMTEIHRLIPNKGVEANGVQLHTQQQSKSILEQMADASRASNLESFQTGHVAMNANLLILAGHETTAGALSYTTFLLALHPNVQERLAEEIDDYLQEHPDESLYDAAQELEYLDMVWQESLRMYTPAGMMTRRCDKDTVVNGIPIKEGCLIAIPQYYLHYREDYWTDPEVFNPERFSKSQKSSVHPGAYIPFGSGPRFCVGMRLAVMEAKMALIEVLSKFRIVKAPETKTVITLYLTLKSTMKHGPSKVPLELEAGSTMCLKDTIYLRFEERQ